MANCCSVADLAGIGTAGAPVRVVGVDQARSALVREGLLAA